jgi:hypothetical protein
MGLRRMKAKTCTWRLMERYEAMKRVKGSGKTITATARKMAVIIWNMLTEDAEFDAGKMTDRSLAKKSSDMGVLAAAATAETAAKEKPAKLRTGEVKTTGVAGKKRKKAG